MILKQVVVSGTVGKQVFATTVKTVLKGLAFTPSAANATIKIRDGNASGEVVLFARAHTSGGTQEYCFNEGVRFDKGMHVKIIGANAEAYLYLN